MLEIKDETKIESGEYTASESSAYSRRSKNSTEGGGTSNDNTASENNSNNNETTGLGEHTDAINKSSRRAITTTTVRPGINAESPGEYDPNSESKEDEKGITQKNNFDADPVNTYSGTHVIENTIMSLFSGQGLTFKALYNSSHLGISSMGIGWYHNFEKRVAIANGEVYVFETPITFTRYAYNDETNKYDCTTLGYYGYTLTFTEDNTYPYCLDCNSERTEYYDTNMRLAKIVNHQGFETIITYTDTRTKIKDSITGKSIYLEKDSSGKIVRVYDDYGRSARFTYLGNYLVSITDVCSNTLAYSYDKQGRIKSGTDSLNICYFKNTYDSEGRVIKQEDAMGAETLFEYNEDGSRITTNRCGKKKFRQYNEIGQLVSYTDENGNTTLYYYDQFGNIRKETDPAGNSIERTYVSGNKPFVIMEKNGAVKRFFYDTNYNVTRILHRFNGVATAYETFTYNSRNQVITHTDPRGTVTTYTYYSNGMPKTKTVGSRNPISYSYYNGRLTSATDARGNTTTYEYNFINQLIAKKDSNENETYYEYDLAGRLLKETNADCNDTLYTYDGNGQKISQTDTNGNTTYYSYNGNMKLTSTTLPDGSQIRYEYDAEDRLIKTIDQEGHITINEYDDGGRVIAKHFPDGGSVSFAYDVVGNVISETNQMGAVTHKTYDALGNVLTVTDHAGNVTRYQYDEYSRRIRTINPASGTTTYQYNVAGDLLSETDAMGNTKTLTYDAFGNKLSETDAKGNTNTYTYDANNNKLTHTDALGNTTHYTYDARNLLKSIKDAKNNIITYFYDALGRCESVKDAKGRTFRTVYDANGNVIQVIDAYNKVITEKQYNSLNLPSVIVNASVRTVYTYNALGKVATVTDAGNDTKEYSYNSRGQLISVKESDGAVSTSNYDLLGNKTNVTGPLGASTSYSYDALGRLVCETTASGSAKHYSYNALSLKEEIVNARGQTRSFSYDVMGRITGYVTDEDVVSYTYDGNSNILTVTDKNGTVTRTYDALNRVSSYTDTFGNTVGYRYDSVGNLKRVIYPDNTEVIYTYDANNNLIQVTDWENRTTTYTYDANNKVIHIAKPNGTEVTTTYDNMQRIVSTSEYSCCGSVICGYEYEYDELGRISSETLVNNTKICYTYDDKSRVVKKTTINLNNNSETEEVFTYDAAGNIVSDGTHSFVYGSNNRLNAVGTSSVLFDADGNMLSVNGDTYTYDSANRLITSGNNTYTYNAENTRIRNVCGDDVTVYTYNTNCKLSQLLMKTTNGIVTKYVYGLGLIGEEKCGVFKTYHFDYRGSTVAITDESGNITDTFKYDTYGKLTSRTGESFVIFGYNGRDGVITDRNGLIYMRARYYSPELRRFINSDIIAGDITDSITLNRYAYANGNPVSLVDPLGLEAELDEYINANYMDTKNVTLVIKRPVANSREVATIEDGILNNGHSFIRLDDGNGNVEYIGFAAESVNLTNMIFGKNVEGKFIDDSATDWNVAKVYTLTDNQYDSIKDHIESVKSKDPSYNIETFNCTTFAINTVKVGGAAAGNFMTVRKHDWTLPDDLNQQIKNYKALPKWLLPGVATWLIEHKMGSFHGYTPADAAQDLKRAEGTVLLKYDGSIKVITNRTYLKAQSNQTNSRNK